MTEAELTEFYREGITWLAERLKSPRAIKALYTIGQAAYQEQRRLEDEQEKERKRRERKQRREEKKARECTTTRQAAT